MLREYKQKEKETIFTMTLGEIVKATVQCIADFGDEYQKLYFVELDFQLKVVILFLIIFLNISWRF